ncbi:DMT family transporter [Wenxinia saemankumensis]|uniref:Permease of the drug/metabolite transporter (DMT) superfamily n=1 Tax=Wenxinia saemankumensis TaxID=1447782 RepID=A0A1M6G0B4_9RHOB|nr:DMT family transporter [Wenxinia saemankumensis]SHJ03438.1 Permease of the drug/metabolite transporter (DMT) superfamily [Wenxinia saemankumensis]
MGHNARGALIALLAFAFYSSHDAVVKTMGASYSPVQLIFFSVMFSFPLAVVTIMRDSNPGTLIPVHPRWVLVRTVAAVATGLSGFYAFSVLPLAQVYTIIFASPLIITLLAIPVLGEKVGLHRGGAIVVGLAGVIFVLQPGNTQLSLGHAAALVCAFGGSAASIIVRKIGADERPVVLMLYPMLANFVLMGGALAFFYEPMPIAHLGVIAMMSVLGWVGGLAMIAAYKAGEAAVVAPMQYSQIVWATIFGLIFFGETLDRTTMIGAGIIIASGLYIVFRESRGASGLTPVLRTKLRPDTGTFLKSPRLPEGTARRGIVALRGRPRRSV